MLGEYDISGAVERNVDKDQSQCCRSWTGGHRTIPERVPGKSRAVISGCSSYVCQSHTRYSCLLFADKCEALDCVGLFLKRVLQRAYSSLRVKVGVGT